MARIANKGTFFLLALYYYFNVMVKKHNRCIHNNPVKAGMVKKPEEYCWSSIHAYYGTREYPVGLSEAAFVLGIIDQNQDRAKQTFHEFMKQDNEDKCLGDEVKYRKTDIEVKTEIEKLMNGEPIGRLQGMEKAKRNEILRTIKASDGVSLRQISRITGLSVDSIFNT